jgi:type II secretory pathway component PulL
MKNWRPISLCINLLLVVSLNGLNQFYQFL